MDASPFSEKLWDTKRWAFLSGRNRTIRPRNREKAVRSMRKLKYFKDFKELDGVGESLSPSLLQMDRDSMPATCPK